MSYTSSVKVPALTAALADRCDTMLRGHEVRDAHIEARAHSHPQEGQETKQQGSHNS